MRKPFEYPNLVQFAKIRETHCGFHVPSIAEEAGFPYRILVDDNRSPRAEVCAWAAENFRHRFTFIPSLSRAAPGAVSTAYYCENETDAVNLKLRWC